MFHVGLLLGTGLTVIIPEGVSTLYGKGNSHGMNKIVWSEKGSDSDVLVDVNLVNPLREDAEEEDEEEQQATKTALVGASLLAGFLFLLVTEWLTSHNHGHAHEHRAKHPVDNEYRHLDNKEDKNCNTDGRGRDLDMKRSSVTLGLLVHAASDGIALGATKASKYFAATNSAHPENISQSDLVIFVALLCHKIPTALGLAIYLKATGTDTLEIKKSILFFSLAAPLATLVTFVTLVLLRDVSSEIDEISQMVSGMLLLFSGGTFLYVSILHLLGELNIHSLKKQEFVLLCSGTFVPLFLMALHSHED